VLVTDLVDAAAKAGLVPLVIGPHGGLLSGITVDRTYATARSFELDAVVLVGSLPPAADASPGLDARAGQARWEPVAMDPRIVQLSAEMWRHAKVIAAGGTDAMDTLAALGLPHDAPGVVASEDATVVTDHVVALLALHRVWDRFATTTG
jgi:catalase